MGWSILWLEADCQQRFLQQGERTTPSPPLPLFPFVFSLCHMQLRGL